MEEGGEKKMVGKKRDRLIAVHCVLRKACRVPNGALLTA